MAEPRVSIRLHLCKPKGYLDVYKNGEGLFLPQITLCDGEETTRYFCHPEGTHTFSMIGADTCTSDTAFWDKMFPMYVFRGILAQGNILDLSHCVGKQGENQNLLLLISNFIDDPLIMEELFAVKMLGEKQADT